MWFRGPQAPDDSQVGSCNCCFGACSAFTHVTACMLTESPSDPFHRKLRQLRRLSCRSDCFRVEQTSSRMGIAPTEVQRLSRRTVTPTDDGSLNGGLIELHVKIPPSGHHSGSDGVVVRHKLRALCDPAWASGRIGEVDLTKLRPPESSLA